MKKIKLLIFLLLQGVLALSQDSLPATAYPVFLQERISLYDSVALGNSLKTFDQVFGILDIKNRVVHITRSNDSLIIYGMYKGSELSNLLIASTKGKIYILNKNSQLTKERIKQLPVYKYYMTLFRKIKKRPFNKRKELGYWLLTKKWIWTRLKWKEDKSDFFSQPCWRKNFYELKIQRVSSDVNTWGRNDGDLDGLIYKLIEPILLEFVKSKSGGTTTLGSLDERGAVLHFDNFHELGEYLEQQKGSFDKISTTAHFSNRDYSVVINKELSSKFKKICELKNSNDMTIDEYFVANPEVLEKDKKNIINMEFIFDSFFAEQYTSLINKKTLNDGNSIMNDVQYILGRYPACYEALPQIIKLIPR